MTNENYGRLEMAHTVWCGRCGEWDQVSGKKARAAKEFKRSGWGFTKALGWRCPKCKPLA